MGTNYYRVPTLAEMEQKKEQLQKRIEELDMSPGSIERDFPVVEQAGFYDHINPWQEFTESASVHLGKRSGGWRFCWNFHDNKYYSTKQELLAFIKSGRVVDKYGAEQDPEEFIQMALDWCKDGLVFNAEYERKHGRGFFYGPSRWDREVDGLRVSSSTDFS